MRTRWWNLKIDSDQFWIIVVIISVLAAPVWIFVLSYLYALIFENKI